MESFNQQNIHLNELVNSITHGIGALLSLIGLTIMVIIASLHYDTWHIVSFSIFGLSMTILYTASTLYHSAVKEKVKSVFQKLDHTAIYILIAGTYTPFTLITLKGTLGWTLFGVIWGMAFSGIIFQFFFRLEKLKFISALVYLIMGWMVVIAVKPLIAALPFGGLMWLLAGGFFYSFGVVFYLWRKIPFSHGIWHLFVLGGTICHFFSILLYV